MQSRTTSARLGETEATEDGGEPDCWVPLLPGAVNGLMIPVVGPGVGHVALETWWGWAGMRFGLPLQGFVFGDREG